MPLVVTIPSPEEIGSGSSQLFSDIVALARADEPPLPPKDWAYEFSDGHKFEDAVGSYV